MCEVLLFQVKKITGLSYIQLKAWILYLTFVLVFSVCDWVVVPEVYPDPYKPVHSTLVRKQFLLEHLVLTFSHLLSITFTYSAFQPSLLEVVFSPPAPYYML